MAEERERLDHGPVGVGDALDAFAGGIGFIVSTPSVWGYALVPAVLMTLLSCGLSGLFLAGAVRASTAVFGEATGAWGQAGSWALILILGSLGVVVAVLLALVLAQPFSGFALDAISRAQERALTGRGPAESSFLAILFVSLKAVTASVLFGGSILAALFTVNFFFPPAVVVTAPLKFLVCAWMLAWDFLDYPLAQRGQGLRARWRWVTRNFSAFTAFGAAWALLVVVPGVVLLLLPMGVAGAARLVVADERGQRLTGRATRR